mgnify:CR=1 FL=1
MIVDLGQENLVTGVLINLYISNDSFVTVRVGKYRNITSKNSVCATIEYKGEYMINRWCKPHLFGRYVSLQATTTQFVLLEIYEIEVKSGQYVIVKLIAGTRCGHGWRSW